MILFYLGHSRRSVGRENNIAAYFDKLAQALGSSAIRWKVRLRWYQLLRYRSHPPPPELLAASALEFYVRSYRTTHGKSPGAYWIWRKKLFIHSCHAFCMESLRREAVKMVVVWNGLKKHGAILVGAARQLGIPCVFMENGLLPNTTVCDPKGINALNSVPRDPVFYRQLPPAPAPEKVRLQVREGQSPRQASGRDLPSRYLFIPFQVDTDTQILMFSPWITDMRQLFDEVLRLSEKFPQYQLVFKEHPSSPRDYRELHDRLPSDRGMFANEYPTQTLIENAEAILTINSTVGMEALMYGKKVVVLGDAFYAIKGLTLAAGGAAELEAAVTRLPDFSPDEQLRRNFLAWMKNEYLIPGDWRTADEAHCLRVKQRLLSWRDSFPVDGMKSNATK